MRRLLALVAVVGTAGPAAACLNDLELQAHEREFRSEYGRPAEPPPAVDPPAYRAKPVLLGAAGLVLFVGAVALAWPNARPRA